MNPGIPYEAATDKKLTGPFVDINQVASATDYTGLVQMLPQSPDELRSYYEIYNRPRPEQIADVCDNKGAGI